MSGRNVVFEEEEHMTRIHFKSVGQKRPPWWGYLDRSLKNMREPASSEKGITGRGKSYVQRP